MEVAGPRTVSGCFRALVQLCKSGFCWLGLAFRALRKFWYICTPGTPHARTPLALLTVEIASARLCLFWGGGGLELQFTGFFGSADAESLQ